MDRQLGICAIPIFFNVPGISNRDLGSRTEGKFLLLSHTLCQPA